MRESKRQASGKPWEVAGITQADPTLAARVAGSPIVQRRQLSAVGPVVGGYWVALTSSAAQSSPLFGVPLVSNTCTQILKWLAPAGGTGT